MSFFAAQSRVNAAVLKHLANSRVLIAGAEVEGIFRGPSKLVPLGIGAADFALSVAVASSAVPEFPVDTVIEIDGKPYAILASDPDGTGMTVLRVECAQ